MYRIIILVLAFAVTAGCGTAEINGPGEGKTNGENISPQIEVELETTVEVKKENDNLLFEITLTNRGNETVELPFSSGQQFEIVVKNEEGEEIYRYSEGKMFTQALLYLKLEPGDTLSWEDEWDQKVESKWVANGQYEVLVEVLVQDYEENLIVNQGDLIADKTVTIDNEADVTKEDYTHNESLENNAFRQIKVEGENGEYVVTGEARVYEAVFHYAVTEGHFYYIEEWMTVDEGGPSWSTFTIEISIAEDELPVNGTITLELFEESAKDGSKVHQLSVPLETINQ